MPSASVIGRIAIAVAVSCLALVTLTAVAVARPDFRDALGLGPAPAYVVRGHIDVPPAVYASSPYTIVLFARSTCPVCRQSVPSFIRLVEKSKAAGVQVRLLSVAPVAEDELAYAKAIGLDTTEVVGADLKALRVKRVPTVVLVNSQGEIQYAREGATPTMELEDFVRRLTSPGR